MIAATWLLPLGVALGATGLLVALQQRLERETAAVVRVTATVREAADRGRSVVEG